VNKNHRLYLKNLLKSTLCTIVPGSTSERWWWWW